MPSAKTLPEDEARYRNQQMSVRSSGRNNGPPAQGDVKKHTGPSSSVYVRPSSNYRDGNNTRSPRQAMMEREIQLTGRGSGRSLGLQTAVTIMTLIFFVYVGLTGGIVMGEESANADYGCDEIITFEQVIPIPRDLEPTVWIAFESPSLNQILAKILKQSCTTHAIKTTDYLPELVPSREIG
jgi:hypothetical protein